MQIRGVSQKKMVTDTPAEKINHIKIDLADVKQQVMLQNK